MEKGNILEKINNAFGKIVEKYGFKVGHNIHGAPFFLLRTTDSILRVAPSIGRVSKNENFFEAFGAHADMRILLVENLWEDNASILNIFTDKAFGFHTYHVNTSDAYPEFSNESNTEGWLKYDLSDSGINQYVEMIDFLLDKKIFPKVNLLNNHKNLDAIINSKVELNNDLSTYLLNSKGLIFRRIILARLSKNNLYEDICEYHRSFFDEYKKLAQQKQYEYFNNYPIVFEKLYADLKRNYPNWNLNS